MKKFVLFVLCLTIMSAGPAFGAVVFNETFESGGSPPFGFSYYWTKGLTWNQGDLATESGNHVWRTIFKPGSTDTYFGFAEYLNTTGGSGNTMYIKWRMRFGDATHPYSWSTASRSHELKFPDLCPTVQGDTVNNNRIIVKQRARDASHGLIRVYTPGNQSGDVYNHDAPTVVQSNVWYTVQIMLQDNGASGDIVRVWVNNDVQNSPDYSYTSNGNIFNSDQWWQNSMEWAYRNHEVASDQYFYFDDVNISTTFISGSGGGGTTPPACSYGISPSTSSVDSAAHTGSFSVTSTTGCAWTAASNASWITITSGASGSGNGTVAYSVAANSATTQRTGTITAAGYSYTVTQAAATSSCSYSLSSSSANYDNAAHTGSFNVTSSSGCSWTASPGASWITITSGASGSGSGTVAYSVAANSGSSQRTGTITVAGRTFTITQASGAATCTYGVTPTSVNFDSAAHTGSFSVTSASGCAWTASSNAGWITVTSGSPGSGAGTVNYSLASNTSSSQRTGTITAAGMTFTVRQAAPVTASCTYTIGDTSELYNSDAHTGTVTVSTSTSSCAWTAVSNVDWITITAGSSGTGSGTVYYSVEKNSRFFQRIGTVTIAGKTFTIRQGSVLSSWFSNPNLRPPSQLRVQ